jgi:hypothetical protein
MVLPSEICPSLVTARPMLPFCKISFNLSSNTTFEALKPFVFTFVILCAITLPLSEEASRDLFRSIYVVSSIFCTIINFSPFFDNNYLLILIYYIN